MDIWKKKGVIYVPKGEHTWDFSHAQVPTVDVLNDEVWRIYYSSRSKDTKSYTSYIEVEAGSPENILYIHPQPILPLGSEGTFDDCGIMPSCIVTHEDKKYLFYIGWTRKVIVPYHNSIGLAISQDNGKTFQKAFEGPIFDSIQNEPYFTASSYILIEDGLWRMWYLSCTKWENIKGHFEPFYNIKYAESKDGINWKRDGRIAIDFKNDDEGGIARASTLRENGEYKMWYSYRGFIDYRTSKEHSYKIGLAISKDGLNWKREDESVGIVCSSEGWDSEMICYPNILSFGDKRYMFYNGNGFGKTGFGYAVSEIGK